MDSNTLDIFYSIVLDFDEFGKFITSALEGNFGWIAMILGLKIGISFLRESIN